jgi:hypothetical protein
MSAHTPGPWEVVGSNLEVRSVLDGRLVVAIGAGHPDEDAYVVIADARLIAAAPAMKEALMRHGAHDPSCSALHAGDRQAGNLGARWLPGDGANCDCGLGAAIAKAEGK